MTWSGTWFGGGGGGGGGGGLTLLLSVSPSSFDGIDPEAARWTPIAFLVQIRTGDNLLALYKADGAAIPQVAYDADDGLAPLFKGKSTVVQQVNPVQFLVTLLPNGGWSSSDFRIKFVSGVDSSEP